MAMNKQLDGQVALITGAGRGIGRAIALAYADAGAAVACAARSLEQVEDTAARIRTDGGIASAHACDVTQPEQVEALFAASERAHGGVDIVLVNAGTGGGRSPVDGSDMAAWRQVIEVNLMAAYSQSRCAIPYLRRRGGGKILFTGSGVARNAMPGTSAYACGKAGLAMLCRVLARELRDDNIAVNELIPGPVRTAMTGAPEERETDDDAGEPILSIPDEWIKNPPDVTPLALFLATLPNDGPTGQSYSLTGRDMGRI